jgi:hypothetical protein
VGNKHFCQLYHNINNNYYSTDDSNSNVNVHWRVYNQHDPCSKYPSTASIVGGSYRHITTTTGYSLCLHSSLDSDSDGKGLGSFTYEVECSDNSDSESERGSWSDTAGYHYTDHYKRCLEECFPSQSNSETVTVDTLAVNESDKVDEVVSVSEDNNCGRCPFW